MIWLQKDTNPKPMLNQQFTSSNTALFPSLPNGVVIELLLAMIEKSLMNFPDTLHSMFPEFPPVAAITHERFFSHTFSKALQRTIAHAGHAGLFTYHDEHISPQKQLKQQGRKGMLPQEDLGVCNLNNGELVLVIEGKRLYKTTDKQYVSGRTGGIARFKREEHGEDLNLACMVGYIQTNTFELWHAKVNDWIRNENAPLSSPIWDENDCLNPITIKGTHLARCHSLHQRVSKGPIFLHHFWVMVV